MTKRLVVSLWGQPKAGKTHFALSAPDPIEFFDFDLGREGVDHKFKGKSITPHLYEIPLGGLQDQHATELLQKFYREYKVALDALQDLGGGTVVLDTASDLWSVIQAAKLAEVRTRRAKKKVGVDPDDVQVYPYDYSEANLAMANILRAVLFRPDVNGVFIHRAKKVYEGGNETNKLEFQGFGQTPAITQAMVQLFKNTKGRFGKIEVCRFDPDLESMEVKDLTYDTLRNLMFGGD